MAALNIQSKPPLVRGGVAVGDGGELYGDSLPSINGKTPADKAGVFLITLVLGFLSGLVFALTLRISVLVLILVFVLVLLLILVLIFRSLILVVHNKYLPFFYLNWLPPNFDLIKIQLGLV